MQPRFVAATEDIASAPRMMQKQGGGDDEESIESYMERLMQRVRGDSESAPTSVTQTGVAQTGVTQTRMSQSLVKPMTASVSPPTAEDVGSTMVAAMMPEDSAESEPASAEAMPRRPAPDLMANLSAMREVANSVAHAAINQHARGKNRKRANRKLFGACLALGGSLVLSYFSWGASSMPGMAGAAAGCTIAMYWMFGAARGFIRLKSGKPLESDTK
jgi:hypothetical protein